MVTRDRTAIVTGSSRGSSATIARHLAQDGLAAPANDAGNAAGEDETAADSAAAGGGALVAKADTQKPDECVQSSGTAEAAFGFDVLVSNVDFKMLLSIAETDDQQIDVDLKEFFNGLLLAAHRLRDGGATVNFSSSVVGHRLHGSAVAGMAGPHPGPGELPVQGLAEAEVSCSWAALAVHCQVVAEAWASPAGESTPTCSSFEAHHPAPASAAPATPAEEGATSATRHRLSHAAQPEGGE